jgi:hypothetical protein
VLRLDNCRTSSRRYNQENSCLLRRFSVLPKNSGIECTKELIMTVSGRAESIEFEEKMTEGVFSREAVQMRSIIIYERKKCFHVKIKYLFYSRGETTCFFSESELDF